MSGSQSFWELSAARHARPHDFPPVPPKSHNGGGIDGVQKGRRVLLMCYVGWIWKGQGDTEVLHPFLMSLIVLLFVSINPKLDSRGNQAEFKAPPPQCITTRMSSYSLQLAFKRVWFLQDAAQLFYFRCTSLARHESKWRRGVRPRSCSTVSLWYLSCFLKKITILPNYWCSYLFPKTIFA